jgi:hypothetical protein
VETVRLIDIEIPKDYTGGTSLTVSSEDYLRIRSNEPPRTLNYVFKRNLAIKMDIDIARWVMTKYPKRFQAIDLKGKPFNLFDELDEMLYPELQKLNGLLIKRMKDLNRPETFKVGIKTQELREQIRLMRTYLPDDEEILPEKEE